MWWPALSIQLEELVRKCAECCRHRIQNSEPLLPGKFPKLPCETVTTDLFVWNNSHYLLIIDYFSRYIEIAKLSSESTTAIVKHTKSIFARHGIPQEIVSDNGLQYSLREFAQFAKEYGFVHNTSSPKNPQLNGEAKRGVRTVIALLKKTEDPYLSLLVYHSMSISANEYSPAELLMNRKIRTTLPILPKDLKPRVPDYSKLQCSEKQQRNKRKQNFDNPHAAHSLTPGIDSLDT